MIQGTRVLQPNGYFSKSRVANITQVSDRTGRKLKEWDLFVDYSVAIEDDR